MVPAPAPLATDGLSVRLWFDALADDAVPAADGSLESARGAANAYVRMAKADNTRRAYRAVVRAWCRWCDYHRLSPLPASGAGVAAFLASERGRNCSPETLKLHGAATATIIRRLHRLAAARCRSTRPASPKPWPGSSAIPHGTGRSGARRSLRPPPSSAALSPDRRPGPGRPPRQGADPGRLCRRPVLFRTRRGIRIENLEPSDCGLRLTLPQTKGSQTEAVMVALPYGDTELCPVRALEQ